MEKVKERSSKSKFQKIKNINERLQLAVKVAAAVMFLTPLVISGIKHAKPYVSFIVKGPEMVKSIEELKGSLFVVTGCLAAELDNVDSTIYKVEWRGEEYEGRIKQSKSGNKYVFIKNGKVGERAFWVNYNYDGGGRGHYAFIDFDGKYIELKEK